MHSLSITKVKMFLNVFQFKKKIIWAFANSIFTILSDQLFLKYKFFLISYRNFKKIMAGGGGSQEPVI